jgi:predicted Zn-dependent protease
VKPVSIMWSQGVDAAEAQLTVSAVRDFLRVVYSVCHSAGVALPPTAIRPFGTWYIPTAPRGSPYSGTTWYVDSSFDATRQQVIGTRFLDLVRDEPWQKSNPHWDVAVIEHDLAESVGEQAAEGRRPEFVLGAVAPELATVLSVYRLRGIVRAEQREQALRRLVVHHFGQVLGLPSTSRQDDVERVGNRRYCTNRCVMRRAATVEEVVRAAEQEGGANVALCDRCRHDIIEIMVMQGRSPN